MTSAVLAHTDLTVISADELAMYRYTDDIVAYLRDDVPIAWSVQLGARYFPDLVISFAAYALSLGQPRAWGAIFALLNVGLVYGALRILLKAGGVAERERSLVGVAFMAALLLLTAISLQGGANLLRTMYHNTLIAPALVFCALPMLAARAERPWHPAALAASFGIPFGLVCHSDPLFLAWSVAPTLGTALVMALAGRLEWRGLIAVASVTLVALVLAKALRPGFDALPFLYYRDSRVLTLRLGRLHASLPKLAHAYAAYGTTTVLLLDSLAVVGGALSLWATSREPRDVRRFRLYVLVLFATTAIATPAAMLTGALLSFRYLLWGIAVAALPIALGIADGLGRLRSSSAVAGFAVIVLLTGTPFFMLRARDAAVLDRPEDALIAALDAEAASGHIGPTGLASYWVAHKVTLRSDFTLAPLGKDAQPFLLAGNAFAFWDWRSGCPQRRHFTFVITAGTGPQKVLPSALKRRFGAPAKIVPVAGTSFAIWRYPDGLAHPEDLYRNLVVKLESRGVSTRALDRCLPPAERAAERG